jgi:hypothetical protein
MWSRQFLLSGVQFARPAYPVARGFATSLRRRMFTQSAIGVFSFSFAWGFLLWLFADVLLSLSREWYQQENRSAEPHRRARWRRDDSYYLEANQGGGAFSESPHLVSLISSVL